MIKLAIVDDDSQHADILKAHIIKYGNEHNQSIDVSYYESGLALITNEKFAYDLYLLDIEMPHMDGIEVAKTIRKKDPHAIIIFITNMPQFAIKGYEVEAFDYMIKPTDYISFERQMYLAIQALDYQEDYTLLVPIEDGFKKVKASDIVFIEVRDHWLYIHTMDETMEMLGTLSEMEERLGTQNIIRCSKSYLVNLQHVTRMKADLIMLQGGHQLKISRSRRKEVQNAFIDYYSKQQGTF